MHSTAKARPLKARTLFLSDIHLGFKRSRTRELLDFLHTVEAECIVLVGDIIDALSLAKRFFWAPEHTQVLRLLLARRRAGARLVYLPGNHDASFAIAADMLHGQVEVHREWVHRTARGQRLLVMHGDQFDHEVEIPGWLYWLGDKAYESTLTVNHAINSFRRRCGFPYLPLIERLKLALPTSARYIARFEHVAAGHAAAGGYDGIVCGHIHRANLVQMGPALYCNTGDWVESCSALIEDLSGELHLKRWPHALPERAAAAPLIADAA